MLSYKEIEVPDIGDFRSVPVVEILVQEGERVEVNTPLITVKTEKGPMDVPSPLAGRVQEMIVHVDDRVTRGSSILLLETEVEDPAPGRAEPTIESAAEADVETGARPEPVWKIDPIIDPTTTEPRLPVDVAAVEEDDFFEDTGDGEIPTLTDDGEIPTLDEVAAPPAPDADDVPAVVEAVPAAGAPDRTDFAAEEAPARAADHPPAARPAGVAASEDAVTVQVPDIGDFSDVEVIEVHVAVGDTVEPEDPLITLESDKATMDVPSTAAGSVSRVLVNVGDRVSEGSPIVVLGGASAPAETAAAESGPAQREAPADRRPPAVPRPEATPPIPDERPAAEPERPPEAPAARPPAETRQGSAAPPPVEQQPAGPGPAPPPITVQEAGPPDEAPHASPAVRRFARELGVDLSKVVGSGPKGRIVKEDVQRWVKKTLTEAPPVPPAAAGGAGGAGIPEMPDIDFSQFGVIEKQPLSRIKKLTAVNLTRAWLHVPHVTQHDEADITELEAFRKDLKKEEETRTGARITMLSFLMKACVVALKEFPSFNSSLEKGGENLILKRYYHIGIAVDTSDGLVVPVVRDVDRKSIRDLAGELADISGRARERKLSPKELQGASFTISSLGGIGGTAFTPIVNAPEVAILGVSRSSMKPVYAGGEFVPRLILPLSISYDHRVIDGAEAARFTSFLATVLADVRRLLL